VPLEYFFWKIKAHAHCLWYCSLDSKFRILTGLKELNLDKPSSFYVNDFEVQISV